MKLDEPIRIGTAWRHRDFPRLMFVLTEIHYASTGAPPMARMEAEFIETKYDPGGEDRRLSKAMYLTPDLAAERTGITDVTPAKLSNWMRLTPEEQAAHVIPTVETMAELRVL